MLIFDVMGVGVTNPPALSKGRLYNQSICFLSGIVARKSVWMIKDGI